MAARAQVAIRARTMQRTPPRGRHKKAPLEGSCQAEGLTERCCRSALCGRLARIATAPTPLRHGFAVPPLLKERLWGAARYRSRAGHAGTRTRDARYLRRVRAAGRPRRCAADRAPGRRWKSAGECGILAKTALVLLPTMGSRGRNPEKAREHRWMSIY